jgi:hypothetical protein
VTIPYNEYSVSPSIGRGGGSSTDAKDPGYGALRIFIDKVKDYTDDKGADALPAGQKVVFEPSKNTGREVSALRAGIQFANSAATPKPVVSEPSWGFIYNSLPFGMRFEQMLAFLYDAKLEGFKGNGLELAQSILDSRGGSQIVLPVVGSTMQGSGYFPRPIGKPVSAAMTMARWPDDALKVLLEARDETLASLAGPDKGDKTDAQKDFSAVLGALTKYGASIGATKFEPGVFPAKTGLADGETCKLVN